MSSTKCPNCGYPTTSDDRFCSNCGTRLEPVTEPDSGSWTPSPPSPAPGTPASEGDTVIPGVGRKNAWEYERDRLRNSSELDDDWSMSDLGPPPPRKRRTWLWIIIGILGLLVISCCVFMWWIGATDSGQEWFSGIATEAAEIIEATEQASSTPSASPAP